ncbi:unnamed protein product [Malus baccata var. baccata]
MQQGSSFLTDLKHLPTEAASAGTRYNVPLINSLVLYVGMQHEIIQEQITRVLLERLIANHLIHGVFGLPWLSLSRIRCAPEIEKLFGSVSRSCGGPKPVDERHDLYF